MTHPQGIDPPPQPSSPPTGPSLATPPHTEPVERPPAGFTSHGRVRRSRASAVWVGLILVALVLIALLIFIVQNSHIVTIHYLGFHGRISLAVALLLAAIAGLLLVAIPGTTRIIQLRHAVKKNAVVDPAAH
jgi:uncharacterized integral membrane protein